MRKGTRKNSPDYDMIIGPTADDDIHMGFKTYYSGMVGGANSETPRLGLITNLKTEIRGVQYCIGKQEAADALIERNTKSTGRIDVMT